MIIFCKILLFCELSLSLIFLCFVQQSTTNKSSEFFNMDWDENNFTHDPMPSYYNPAIGFHKWQQIPPENEVKGAVTTSKKEKSIETQSYVPYTLPVVNVDRNQNIVLDMYCVRGNDNKLLDAGKGKLCAQILAPLYDSAFDAELHRFLSNVLQVSRDNINVTRIGTEHERRVTVDGKSLTGVVAVERFLEVLEPPSTFSVFQ